MRALTFADFETSQRPDSNVADADKCPLDLWYDSVRQKPISLLPVEDLAKACRQKLCVEQVVPIALDALEKEPLAGSIYDGELLVALRFVTTDYWRNTFGSQQRLCGILATINTEDLDDECLREAVEVLRNSCSDRPS